MQQLEYLGAFLPRILSRPILPFRGAYTVTMREDEGSAGALDTLSSLLEDVEPTIPRLHLGWGSFRNLDIVAARKSSYAIVCDLNLRQIELWSRCKAIIALAQTPRHFVELFADTEPTQPPLRRHSSSISDWLGNELSRRQSWLGSAAAYAHIRQMVLESRFELLCCDLRDYAKQDGATVFQQLGQALRRMRQSGFCQPDTLYLSNIPWMLMNPQGFFGEAHGPGETEDGFRLMVNNLEEIALLFYRIVSAHRPTDASTTANRQWQTLLYEPTVFFEHLYEDHRKHSSCDQTYRPGC